MHRCAPSAVPTRRHEAGRARRRRHQTQGAPCVAESRTHVRCPGDDFAQSVLVAASVPEARAIVRQPPWPLSMSSSPASELTFDAVAELLDHNDDAPLLDALDQLAGAALTVSALATGSLIPLSLIGPKNELVRIGKALIKRLAKPTNDFAERARRLDAAHCIVVYTAFFDAAGKLLTAEAQHAGMKRGDRKQLKKVLGEAAGGQPVILPAPFRGTGSERTELENLYQRLSRELERQVLKATPSDDNELILRLQYSMGVLAHRAFDEYIGQYIALAQAYPEFLIWAQLNHWHEHSGAFEALGVATLDLSERIEACASQLDVGLTYLSQVVESFAQHRLAGDPARAIVGLARSYDVSLRAPIVADAAAEQTPGLSYPSKSDIYIPQAFRATTIDSAAAPPQRLEDETAWSTINLREDLGTFLLGYLSASSSQSAPLVILGHPGSGKSLLTEILAARLAQPVFNCIRIPLRDVNPEAEIQDQVEDYIYRTTGHRVQWPLWFEELRDAPPVLIFDGFDELLQATGRVHANYLERLQRFQARELIQGRPVRLVATSRITLIDKAIVPTGAMILRLEEFDVARQAAWLSVWNKANATYFARAHLAPFSLPEGPHVRALAQQPLLLMMLALYHSAGHTLGDAGDLSRPQLYDNLLREFIRRERGKDSDAVSGRLNGSSEAPEDVSQLAQLRVAAMSMFNRRTLSISREALDQDLEYFDVTTEVPEGSGRPLSEGEKVLGGFFFIYESRAAFASGAADSATASSSSYEFLHATFSEFLTADFTLSHLCEQAAVLAALRATPALRGEYERRLAESDSFGRGWFAALSHTTFHSRPVVVDMLREWAPHASAPAGLEHGVFVELLGIIASRHLRHVLEGRLRSEEFDPRGPYTSRPLHVHYAIYALNLVTIYTVLLNAAWRFVGPEYPHDADGPHPWDTLVAFWRGAFTPDLLSGLGRLMSTARDGADVVCAATPVDAPDLPGSNRLGAVYVASAAVGDHVLGCLAGLSVWDLVSNGPLSPREASVRLEDVGIDVELQAALRHGRAGEWELADEVTPLEQHVRAAVSGQVSRSHAELLASLATVNAPLRLRRAARLALPGERSGPFGFPAYFAGPFIRLASQLDSQWCWRFVSDFLESPRIEQLVRNSEAAAREALRLSGGDPVRPSEAREQSLGRCRDACWMGPGEAAGERERLSVESRLGIASVGFDSGMLLREVTPFRPWARLILANPRRPRVTTLPDGGLRGDEKLTRGDRRFGGVFEQ